MEGEAGQDRGEMTLGRAAQEKVYLIECRACKHKAQIDLALMAQALGESFPLEDLRPKLKCARCGSKKTISTTLWKSATTTEAFVRKCSCCCRAVRFRGRRSAFQVKPLLDALNEWAAQNHYQLVIPACDGMQARSQKVYETNGMEALDKLLAGTRFTYWTVNARTVAIQCPD